MRRGDTPPGRVVAVLALVAVSAAVAACGGGGSPEPGRATPPAWRAVGVVPHSRDARGQLAATPDGLFVAVRRRGRGADSVSVVRWAGGRWAGDGRSFAVDSDVPTDLVARGRGVCLVAPHGGIATVRCLTGGTWKQAGAPARIGRGASADLVVAGGRLAMLTVAPQRRGGTRIAALGLRDGGWSALTDDPLSAPGASTQRPFPASVGGALCVAFDETRDEAAGFRTRVRVRCLADGRWRDRGPAPSASRDPLTSVSGFAAAGGHPVVGVVRRRAADGPSFDWNVVSLDGDRWRPTALGAADPSSAEQGALYSFDGRPWAIVFAQRPLPGAFRIAASIGVRTQDPSSGATTAIGAPLLRWSETYGPATFALAQWRRTPYALWSRPDPTTETDELVLSALRP